MAKKPTKNKLSVLIASERADEAERLGSVLNGSGFTAKVRHLDSRKALDERLKSGADIDLILAQRDGNGTPTAAQVLRALGGQRQAVPVILLQQNAPSGAEVAAGIRMGARDLLAMDEDQHLIAVVGRELETSAERRAGQDLAQRLAVAEDHCQQLLRDAPLSAIVHDSMFVMAGEAFCELFGIDPEEAAALSVKDILDTTAQADYEALHRQFASAPQQFSATVLSTRLAASDARAEMDCAAVRYNGAHCLQLRVRPQPEEPPPPPPAESATSSRRGLLERLAECLRSAQAGGGSSCLLCIEVDDFAALQRNLGLTATEDFAAQFADFIAQHFAGQPLSDFESNRVLVLLADTEAAAALAHAEQLGRAIDGQLFEFGEHSQQVTATIGVAPIDAASTHSDSVLQQSMRACEQCRESRTRSGESSKAGGEKSTAQLYQPEQVSTNTDTASLLRQAFKNAHLQPLFQPLMRLQGGPDKNYELLIGIAPAHREHYPASFTAGPLAVGDQPDIDRCAILTSLQKLAKKTDCTGDERLHVPLGRQSLQNSECAAWLASACKKAAVNPAQICVQLREQDAATSIKAAATLVKHLRACGCGAVLTGFGTRAQSPKLLQQIPFDHVRLDESFAAKAQQDKGAALQKLLRQLAAQKIVALVPGVDDVAILPVLWESGAAYIQGGYVGGPSAKMDHQF
ncbi:MAG: GGDEF domain-containing protein [Cellvibrionales bacterium]|nr:GGDEF domain-containing protein [Cellvibrionales bacterium]